MPRPLRAACSAAIRAFEITATPEQLPGLPAILHEDRPREAETGRGGGFGVESAPADAEDARSDFHAGDGELAWLLSAIADEVQHLSAAARAAIVLESGGRIMHVRRYLPRNQAAGAVQVIKAARGAMLAHVAREASHELASRQQAAIRKYAPGRTSRRPKPPEGFESK